MLQVPQSRLRAGKSRGRDVVCDVVCDKLLVVGHKAGGALVRIRGQVNAS